MGRLESFFKFRSTRVTRRLLFRYRLNSVWRGYKWTIARTTFGLISGFLITQLYFSFGFGIWADIIQLELFNALKASRPYHRDIVVVGIDEVSKNYIGISSRVPFPRQWAAKLLHKLYDAEPKGILFDAIIGAEEDVGNEALVAALRRGKSIIGNGTELFSSFGKIIKVEKYSGVAFSRAAYKTIFLIGRPFMHLNCLMSAGYDPKAPIEYRVPLVEPLEGIFERTITPPGVRDFINFYGPPKDINQISMKDVLMASPEKLKKLVGNKLVIIGSTAQLKDNKGKAVELFDVPGYRESMFGVQVKATRAANLLDGSFIRRSSVALEHYVVLLTTLFIAVVVVQMTPLNGALILIAASSFWALVSYIAYTKFYYYIPGGGVVVPIAILLALISFFFQTGWYKGKLRATEKLFNLTLQDNSWSKKENFIKRVYIAFFGACLAILLFASPFGTYTAYINLNYLTEYAPRKAKPKGVLLIGIDDVSIQSFGASFKQPFPLDVLEESIRIIHRSSPKLLIADLLLSREEPGFGGELLINALRHGLTVIGYRPDANGKPINGIDKYYPHAASAWVPLSFYAEEPVRSKIAWKNNRDISDIDAFPLLKPLKHYLNMDKKAPGREDLINYYGPPGTIPRISLVDFYAEEPEKQKELVEDKIIFLSYQTVAHRRSATVNMQHYVPGFQRQMFDSEIQATILSNLIDGSYIRKSSLGLELGMVFVFSLLTFLVASFFRPKGALLTLLIGVLVWVSVSYLGFHYLHFYFPGLVDFLIVIPIVIAIVLFNEASKHLETIKNLEGNLGLKLPNNP